MASIKTYSVYGSPGTGKTTDMIRRVGLLHDHGFEQDDIIFLSHTKAAAMEASDRIGVGRLRSAGTIHSLCFNMLGLTRPMVVDHKRTKAFAESIGVAMRGGSVDDNEQVEVGDEYMAVLGLSITTFKPLREVFDHHKCNGTWQQCEYFVDRYQAWKTKNGLIDFNDMLLRFVANPVPCTARVLLIDEAQDLSPLQWQVIETLMANGDVRQVHIAGDDDQAIFIWGGADPAGMVRFEEKYNAQRLVLPQSYRIPQVVHTLAHKVIQRVPDRVEKEYAARDERGTLSEHNDWYGLSMNKDQSTMILARTGARKREIERHLVSECVPYLTDGGFPGPLQNKTARAIRALHALRRGESVSAVDMNILRSAMTARAAAAIDNDDGHGSFSPSRILSWEDGRVINMPPWHARYYDKVDVDTNPSVRLMTIHASKGRESDRVIVDTTLTQRVANGMSDDPASEARVFYVAVTRARHQLDIVHGQNGYDL